MATRIEPLTAELWESFASEFRRVPTFQMCWCQYWRLRSKDFAAARVPELRERLRIQADSERPPGLVALDGPGPDARAVGWVGLGPRADFERIVRSRVIPTIDDRPVWSIVCFAVSSAARGQGIARALLDGAIDFAASRGVRALEAYPVRVGAADGVQPAAAFTGVLSTFVRAGFSIVADRASDPSAATQRVVVRRELA